MGTVPILIYQAALGGVVDPRVVDLGRLCRAALRLDGRASIERELDIVTVPADRALSRIIDVVTDLALGRCGILIIRSGRAYDTQETALHEQLRRLPSANLRVAFLSTEEPQGRESLAEMVGSFWR